MIYPTFHMRYSTQKLNKQGDNILVLLSQVNFSRPVAISEFSKYRKNPRRKMPRHLLMKLTKTKHKERILKAEREKEPVIYKGNP